jgi:hypothetical protein
VHVCKQNAMIRALTFASLHARLGSDTDEASVGCPVVNPLRLS